jgi:hypothetical protein
MNVKFIFKGTQLDNVTSLIEEKSHCLLVVSNCLLFHKGMDSHVHEIDDGCKRTIHDYESLEFLALRYHE